MRVLYLTHSLAEVDGVGRYGTEVLRRVVPELASARVLIARKHRGLSPRLPAGLHVKVALPPDHWLYVGWPKFVIYFAWSFPAVLRAARGADLIHCLSDYPHALLATLAGRLLGKPVVISGHGTYSVAPFRYRGHRSLIRFAYGRAQAVIMGSNFALARLAEQIVLPHAGVVPYGVDPEQCRGGVGQPFPDGIPRRYVLTIGELKERKGHHISLPAFLAIAPRHPDVHLVVVGNRIDGDPYFEARKQEVRAAGLESRVHFVGLVAEERKLALLAHAEAFLLTSVTAKDGGFEAFGLVFLEANACGVPTVGIKDSGAEDAIRHDDTGLLAAAGSPTDVSVQLDRVLGDRALHDRLGKNGIDFARACDWNGSAAQIVVLYRRLLGAARSPR